MEDSKIKEEATIRKESITLKTYPYSDPSPIPEFGRLYPYNRFDGYTTDCIDQTWEMIVMENAFIKLWINPAVGGKIWGAIEKSTGREFIYFNHVAKFRDVAMRGPWTSGGMEINMGIIGHTPSCSAPVDYKMVEKKDGSVSCFIGATDWPSRTEWRVEINLSRDAAYFKTKNWWHNNSCLPQSYYQWNNVGIKASGNLEYIYPGQQRIGHDGSARSWPEDESKRKIAFYDQNDHGEYKSYHIVGSYTDFWGCYWHADQFGMGHFAPYDEKPGKKIWIWGLSRYGMIWEDLLTDNDGQYTELQSGRLFNQSIASSSKTPFKHRSFLPYTSDIWEEHWFPIKNLGGLTYGGPKLSFHIMEKHGKKQLHLCANEPLHHNLKILNQDGEVLHQHIFLGTMETCVIDLPGNIVIKRLIIFLDDEIIYNGPEQNTPLERPTKMNGGYDFNSVQACYIQAKEWERQRFFERAILEYKNCLEKDPFFIDALNGLAGLYFKQMSYIQSLNLLRTSLAVDTYNPEANYLYGLVNNRLKNNVDAKDGFSIASQSLTYRAASYIELAKLFLQEDQLEKASNYVLKAGACGSDNLQSVYLSIIINNLKGHKDKSLALIQEILIIDPINYFANFEMNKVQGLPLMPLTVSELPYETYMELAAFYTELNLHEDALKIIQAAPEYPMVKIWEAYLYDKLKFSEKIIKILDYGSTLSADFVFPHREEDIKLLRWAINLHDSWKFKYFLALAYIQNLQNEEALTLLNRCALMPDFYPFYIVRGDIRYKMNQPGVLEDYKHAFNLAPNEWRTILNLSKYYSQHDNWSAALAITAKGYKRYPNNYYLGLKLARCFMHTKKFEQGISLMTTISILPNEGASEGRNSWRETHLSCAINAIDMKNTEKANHHILMARIWPENMGIGKPHHVDERLEDYLELICLPPELSAKRGNLIEKICNYRTHDDFTPYSSIDFISILLLQKATDKVEIERILKHWTQQDPMSLPLKWASAIITDNQIEIKKLSKQKLIVKEILPYAPNLEDRSFFFIKKLYRKGLFNAQMYLQPEINILLD